MARMLLHASRKRGYQANAVHIQFVLVNEDTGDVVDEFRAQSLLEGYAIAAEVTGTRTKERVPELEGSIDSSRVYRYYSEAGAVV